MSTTLSGGGSTNGRNRQKRYNGIISSFIGWHSIKIYCEFPSFLKCATNGDGSKWELMRVRYCIWFMFVMLSKGLEILIYRLVWTKNILWITLSRIFTYRPTLIHTNTLPIWWQIYLGIYMWVCVCVVYLDPLSKSQNKQWIKCECDELANPFFKRKKENRVYHHRSR